MWVNTFFRDVQNTNSLLIKKEILRYVAYHNAGALRLRGMVEVMCFFRSVR